MPVTRLECPDCGAVLKRSEGVPEGRKVRCPSCSAVFTAKAKGDNKSPDRRDPRDENERPASRGRKADRDEDEDGVDDEPLSRSKKARGKKAKKQSNAVLIAVPIVGAVALLAVAVVLYLAWPDKNEKAVADNGGANPAARPQPGVQPGPAKGNPAGGPKGAAGNGTVGLEVGNLAMEIEGEDIDGKRFKLSDYRGKVVVLDFWGNW